MVNSIVIMQSGAKINVTVDTYITEDHGTWVCYCPALELSSYGDSPAEAHQSFNEALDIFIDDTVNKGTLKEVLSDLGWKLRQIPHADYQPPAYTDKQLSKKLKAIPSQKKPINVAFPASAIC